MTRKIILQVFAALVFLAYAFAVIVYVTSLPVHAETWAALADTNEGDRILIDRDSWTFDGTGDTRTVSVHTLFFNTKVYSLTTIPVSPCWTTGSGVMIVQRMNNETSKILKRQTSSFFWDWDGTKTYDVVGKLMCAVALTQELGHWDDSVRPDGTMTGAKGDEEDGDGTPKDGVVTKLPPQESPPDNRIPIP